MQWRTLVAANKELYVSLPKKQKMLLSQSIVNAVRSQTPPGRFLGKDAKSDTWQDVGDKRAQEKTSQALREGAPEIRKNLKGKGTKSEKKDGEPQKTDEPERSVSREQMPPPAITVVPPPTSFHQVDAESPPTKPPANNAPKPPVAISNPDIQCSSSQQQQKGDNKAPEESMPPPPTQITEGDLSFGSIGLMTDTEQARLMQGFSIGSAMSHQNTGESQTQHTIPESQPAEFPPQDIAHPVDGGLEPVGFSFGSVMSIGTIPGGNLERGGLSIGSTMSYSVCNETSKPYGGGMNTLPSNEYSGAPDLHDIGASFGSLTLLPGDRERIIKEAHNEMETAAAAAPPTTFLEQQRSRGNLLACEDSDDEESAQTSANNSAGWEKLQAALAAQKMSNSIAPPPMPGARYDGPPSSFQIPTALQRDFSNMSAVSMGGDHMYGQPQQQQQYHGYATTTGDDEPLPFNPTMPPPPPVMKKSDNWAGEELKGGFKYS